MCARASMKKVFYVFMLSTRTRTPKAWYWIFFTSFPMMIERSNLQRALAFCSIFKAHHAEERNELMMASKLLIKQVDRKKKLPVNGCRRWRWKARAEKRRSELHYYLIILTNWLHYQSAPIAVAVDAAIVLPHKIELSNLAAQIFQLFSTSSSVDYLNLHQFLGHGRGNFIVDNRW